MQQPLGCKSVFSYKDISLLLLPKQGEAQEEALYIAMNDGAEPLPLFRASERAEAAQHLSVQTRVQGSESLCCCSASAHCSLCAPGQESDLLSLSPPIINPPWPFHPEPAQEMTALSAAPVKDVVFSGVNSEVQPHVEFRRAAHHFYCLSEILGQTVSVLLGESLGLAFCLHHTLPSTPMQNKVMCSTQVCVTILSASCRVNRLRHLSPASGVCRINPSRQFSRVWCPVMNKTFGAGS